MREKLREHARRHRMSITRYLMTLAYAEMKECERMEQEKQKTQTKKLMKNMGVGKL